MASLPLAAPYTSSEILISRMIMRLSKSGTTMVAHIIWREISPVSEQTIVVILSICEFSDDQLKLHMPAPVLLCTQSLLTLARHWSPAIAKPARRAFFPTSSSPWMDTSPLNWMCPKTKPTPCHSSSRVLTWCSGLGSSVPCPAFFHARHQRHH